MADSDGCVCVCLYDTKVVTCLLDQISKMVELGSRSIIMFRIPEYGSIQARWLLLLLLLLLLLTNFVTVTVELIVIVVKEELMLKHGFKVAGLGEFVVGLLLYWLLLPVWLL